MDTDPELRELVAQGKEIAKEAKAGNERADDRAKRRDRWALAFLAVLVCVGLLNLQLNSSNHRILDNVARNQVGIDELVSFVHDAQAQAASGEQSAAVRLLIDVLCATSDPVRIAACARLTPG